MKESLVPYGELNSSTPRGTSCEGQETAGLLGKIYFKGGMDLVETAFCPNFWVLKRHFVVRVDNALC